MQHYPNLLSPPPAAAPPPPPASDLDENSVRSIPMDDEHGEYGDNDSRGSNSTPIASSYQKVKARNGTIPAITNYGLSPSLSGKPRISKQAAGRYEDHPGLNPTWSSGVLPIHDDDDPRRSPLVRQNGAADNNNHNGSNEDSDNNGDFSNYSMSSMMRGDTTLRPNTGNTNAESGTFIPGSLREKASSLRWMTIATTVTAIVWEGFAFLIRLLSPNVILNPAKIVLGAYLGVFCALILGVELDAPLRDNFGFLYNPLTRGLCLLMMSTMALGVLSTWWESLLGLAFITCGVGYIYFYGRHPEYRRWQDYNESAPTAWQEIRMYWTRSSKDGRGGRGSGYGAASAAASAIWADPDEEPRLSSWNSARQSSAEARSLLHNV